MFADRIDAAQQLAEKLQQYKDNPNVVILAIPRGGLEIGSILAKQLHVPLEALFVKKLAAPGYEELAIGAVTLDNYIVDPLYKAMHREYIQEEIERIRTLLQARQQQYYADKKQIDLKDKIVILTDDGVATGKTFLLALDLLKKSKPKKIIAAIPVAPRDTLEHIKQKADEVVCLLVPSTFYAVGQFYQNFEQVSDEEAIRLLREAHK